MLAGANSSHAEVTYLIIEAFVALMALLVAFALPHFASPLFAAVEKPLRRFARRRALVLVVIGVTPVLIRLALLPAAPAPQPGRHDEFSFLLAGDTFAAGRLTNPTHPLWTHFETFHEDQQPTYMSMYPPAQGIVLAAGKILFGNPWFGICVAVGLMCATIGWALQGWLPPEWALLGAVLAVLRIGIYSYWMNSYWGGAASAIGGALVLGALPRLMRKPRVPTALWLALGVVILANSRPFEGFVFTLPVAGALVLWLRRERPPVPVLMRQVILPVCLTLLIAGVGMGYYNSRVFGSAVKLPYQVNRATYAVSPVFLWQSPSETPQYRHKVMRDFYLSFELRTFERARTLSGFFDNVATKFNITLFFFLGALAMLPLMMLPSVLRDRRVRFLLIAGAVFSIGLFANAFTMAHYLAPATALLYAVVIQSMRHLRLWRPGGQPVGLFLVRAVPALSVLLCVLHLAWVPLTSAEGLPRAQVEKQLEALPGRQLAIVRYAPQHDPLSVEWVYNAADIDSSQVVWAREMDRPLDRQLTDYFKDRKVWLVEPDCRPPKVSPYVF